MEKLTETQINFLVVTFFKAPDKFLGAPLIAKTLLEKGECIVAGTTERIWNGGVGNFISIKNAPDSWGCSVFSFNLESFLSSEYTRDVINDYLLKKEDEILILKNEINAISDLISLTSENPSTTNKNN